MSKKRVSRKYYEYRRSIGYDVSDLEVRQLRPWAQSALYWLIIAGLILLLAGVIGGLWAFSKGESIPAGFGAATGLVILAYLFNLALAIVFGAIYIVFILVREIIKAALFK